MKHICIIVLYLASINASAQCASELCRRLEEARNQNLALSSNNQRLIKEITRLQKELGEKERIIAIQRREIERLQKIIDDNNSKPKPKIDNNIKVTEAQVERQKFTEDSLRLIIRNQEDEILRLRKDSLDHARKYEKFKENHLIIEDGTVIPYEIPLGPIQLIKEPEPGINPTPEENRLLRSLGLIQRQQKVRVIVQIQTSRNRLEKVSTAIKKQLEEHCTNCEFIIEPMSSNRWQMSLKFLRPPSP